MKKTLIGAAAVALGLAGALAFVATPASAEPTTRCKSVAVNLTDRRDNGSDGNQWAKDTMTRTLTVCLDNEAGAPEGKAYYVATVVDAGTFTTVRGKSPNKLVPLAQGITGTVNGGFRVPKFTAPKVLELSAPDPATTSGEWASTAVNGSEGATIGSYRWQYKTACETYTDNNGAYIGDITVKCVTPENPTYTKPTCKAYGIVKFPKQDGVKYEGKRVDGKAVVTATAEAGYAFPKDAKAIWAYDVEKLTGETACPTPTTPPVTPPTTPPVTTEPVETPTATESTPVGAQLPVTGGGSGVNVPAVAGVAGIALIAAGAGLLLVLRRRRDNKVEFSA